MAAPAERAIRIDGGDLRLRVRLTPKASRDAIGALETLADGSEVLLCRVRALPSEGAANAALEALVARTAGVGRTRVEVVSGHGARIKTVVVRDAAPDLADRFAVLATPVDRPS